MRQVFLFMAIGLMIIIGLVFAVLAQDNKAPQVKVNPDTKQVEITYDLSEDGQPNAYTLTITVDMLEEAGRIVSPRVGTRGDSIAQGREKKITWNVEGTNTHVQITAAIDRKTIINDDGAEMVLIQKGEFQMGDTLNEGHWDERPVHTVYLDAFYMYSKEVTNAQYNEFMRATRHRAPNYSKDSRYNALNQPVVGVTWADARAYCQWAGVRLPTEAEWEKAARGGLVRMRYPWGNTTSRNKANYSKGGIAQLKNRANPVGSSPPNDYGLYDMAGNVWEWCADWYDGGYYEQSSARNPKGPRFGKGHVIRGGSWFYGPYNMRVSFRSFLRTAYTHHNVGFRCVLSATE